jgi:hypothetical protein
MTNANAGTAGLIWGCLWRASLYGLLLGAGFGGFYGAAFGTLTFPLVGTAFGLFFGALAGAVVGLPLGLLDGLLLSCLAVGYRSVGHPNPRRFRLQAGIICAAGSLLALLTDWALHDLPDPDGFATARALRLALDLFLPLSDLDAGVPPDAIILGIWVFTPMLMILVASWLTARLVARWCVSEVSEA